MKIRTVLAQIAAFSAPLAIAWNARAQSCPSATDWNVCGNGGTTQGTNFVGTTNNVGLEIKANSARVMLYTPNATSPILIGGYSGNSVTSGAVGATIAGGGYSSFTNLVTDDYGFVGGGAGNQAGDNTSTTSSSTYDTVGGGVNNVAYGSGAVVGGGVSNTASFGQATVGGGENNTATGEWSTIAGGVQNEATATAATVCGGWVNLSSGQYATIAGGIANTVSGEAATVPGGALNTASGHVSLAAGHRAKANHNGTFVWADYTADADFTSVSADSFIIRAAGGVGIGDAGPDAQLDVEKSGATVARFDRLTSDGTIVELAQAGTVEGTISVSGTTVSYNAFTGSHFGWTDQIIERGTLVVMTGVNKGLHDRPEAERIYGIEPSSKANDPRCLGAYLALLEPAQRPGSSNPHQVMAVGNGDMWVVDTGQNIQPGDFLISSGITGHAMKDDPELYAVGHIVARAAEAVDWQTDCETINGRRHRKISVFFGNFVRADGASLQKIIDGQQKQLQALQAQVEVITSSMSSTDRHSESLSFSVSGLLVGGALLLLTGLGFVTQWFRRGY